MKFFLETLYVSCHIYFLFTRDASYTTQPLELLNEDPKNLTVLIRNSEVTAGEADNHQFGIGDNGKVSPLASPSIGADGTPRNLNTPFSLDHNQESEG